jgi:predicted ester cyclase
MSRTIEGVVSAENKARIREFIERILTAGEIDEYFHEDMVEEVPFPGQGFGLQGFKETLTRIRYAFPDSKWTVEEQIAEGNKVLTRFTWSGIVRIWGNGY